MIGKVFPEHSLFKGLWLPWAGVHHNFHDFEVLQYNCNDVPTVRRPYLPTKYRTSKPDTTTDNYLYIKPKHSFNY